MRLRNARTALVGSELMCVDDRQDGVTSDMIRRRTRPSISVEPPMPVSPAAAGMGKWYHRIELPDGTVTPGDRDQSLVFALYASLLPADLSSWSVLDLGANACGLTIEFARRGAAVTAVEYSKHYLDQAEFVLRATGLRERVSLYLGSATRSTGSTTSSTSSAISDCPTTCATRSWQRST